MISEFIKPLTSNTKAMHKRCEPQSERNCSKMKLNYGIEQFRPQWDYNDTHVSLWKLRQEPGDIDECQVAVNVLTKTH
jgi:hypothetical protein